MSPPKGFLRSLLDVVLENLGCSTALVVQAVVPGALSLPGQSELQDYVVPGALGLPGPTGPQDYVAPGAQGLPGPSGLQDYVVHSTVADAHQGFGVMSGGTGR